MYKCSNCGEEFDTKYLQCPKCGCTRGDIKNAEMHDKTTERIGGIIAIVFVVGLIGIICYGAYLLINPFQQGPTITNISSTTATETTSTDTISTTSGTKASTTTKTTKAQIAGTQSQIGAHKYTVPEGYIEYPDDQPLSLLNYFKVDINSKVIRNAYNYNDVFVLSIMDGTTLKLTNETKKELNKMLSDLGYGEIQISRFNGKVVFNAIHPYDGYSNVIIFYNKGSNLVYANINISGTELTQDNSEFIINVITSIK